MSLNLAEVATIAHLARLDLTPAELELYQEQLSAVLEYADRLATLDLDGVPPTTRAVPMANVLREDQVRPSLSPEDALFNTAARAKNQFLIQAVLEE
jgi:aspartyl-tRNA(Asn)/glutamyl-tRNA(Gln) amidotransferase subunit C